MIAVTEEQVLRLYPELGPQLDPETGEMVEGLIKDISTHSDEDYPSPQNKNSIYKKFLDCDGQSASGDGRCPAGKVITSSL